MELTRKALYDKIWSTPRSRLAKEWEVKTCVITRFCKEYDIPLPPSGYWTRLALNKRDVQIQLQGEPSIKVIIAAKSNENTSRNQQVSKKVKQQSQVITPIPLTKLIESALPAIRKAYRSYNSPTAKRDYRYQYVWPGGENLLRMAVMPEMVERALLLMDSIVRACQENKWKVVLPSEDNRKMNVVFVDGIAIHFTITEQRRQEKIKSADSWHEWDYRYHSLGILRFQYGAKWSNCEIKDGKKLPLEERLDDIIQAFKDEVIAVHQAEKAKKEREYLDGLKRQVERLVDDAQSVNDKCDLYLDEQQNQFAKYEKISKFYNHMRSNVDIENLTSEIKEWFAWVEIKMNELDPANDIDNFNFDIPINVLTQVEKAIASDNERYGDLKQIDVPATLENIVKWKRSYPR